MKKIDLPEEKLSYAMREALRTLRTNIQFCGEDKKVIMLTSCLPGEGKTSTSINLAKTIAELKKSVLLIDADLRKSVMPSRLNTGVKIDAGLSHFLSGQAGLSDVVMQTNVPKMHIMFAGPAVPNPTELLSTPRFEKMLESLREVYDYIIIDTAPLGLVIDAVIIAQFCDGAILVTESGRIHYRLALDVKNKLESSGCSILGSVLNKVDMKQRNGYYGKEYRKKGYGYGEYGTEVE